MTSDTSPPQDLPRFCRSAVFHGPGAPFEVRTVSLPSLGAGETLVQVTCSTICGSDVHTVTGARPAPTPSVLGHEVVGIVAGVGLPPPQDLDGVELARGDRVTWSLCVSCGDCDRCRSGWTQKCRKLFKYGHASAGGVHELTGGLAEYVQLCAGTAILRVPTDLPDEVVCPANCATATIAAAFRVAGSAAGRRVLILGAGMLGLTAAAYAAAQGAGRIVVRDPSSARLARASAFGAEAQSVQDAPDDELFDVVLEVSGARAAVEAAIRSGDVGAHVVLLGSVLPSEPASVDPENLVRRLITVTGVHNYTPEDLRAALSFLARHHPDYPLASLVERSYPLSEINEAFESTLRDRPVRVAIRP